MKKLELGCGDNRRDLAGYENVTIDVIKLPTVDIVSNLGFSYLPIEDSSIDFVQAIDVLEHIPKCVWLHDEISGLVERWLPFIHLMNQIFRVLKDGGRFYSEVPYTDTAYNRDPTHVTRLSDDWHVYFTDRNLYTQQGIIACKFKDALTEFRDYREPNDILCTTLFADKSNTVAKI